MSVPQLRPLLAGAALSTQVATPVAQEVTPALHRVGLTEQAAPSVQSRQAPFLQTWLLPQAVPSAALRESTHLCAPVAHEVVPILQTVGLVEQLIAAAQLTQRADALQTRSVPQLVPASARVVASTQAAEPPAHDSVPSRQGAPGLVEQRWPATHPRQVPRPSQTRPLPQAVPASTGVSSIHTGVPEPHCRAPLRQGVPGLVAQAPPFAQATHAPAMSHTMPEPHDVPPATFIASTQPPSHSTDPLKHGEPGLVEQEPEEAQPAPHLPCRHLSPEGQLTPLQATSIQAPPTQTKPGKHAVVPQDSGRQVPW